MLRLCLRRLPLILVMALQEQEMKESYILELNAEPIRFEPVNKLTNVFFDEANCQVFAVRSGGTTGVVVKGPSVKDSISFRMADKGEVNSMKFSPDWKVLSTQRSPKSVEFVNFCNGDLDGLEYSQSCRGKTTKILGFAWTNINEVVFVTDHGIEHYQVIPEKRTLKTLKTYSVSVNWYVYHAASTLLLLSSGSLCNVMHPFQFKHCNVFKLSKFEIDLPVSAGAQKSILLERDISIATVYDKTCILVLRHQSRFAGSSGAEIVIYSLHKDGPPRKTDILKLDKSGRFAVNVIDNVIVVHHQSSKNSMLYDIRMPGESDGFIIYHSPVVTPCPIKPFLLKIPTVPTHNTSDGGQICCELYSPNWVVFQPNIIIDAKLGCLWHVHMHLDPIVELIEDKSKLIDFLLLRQQSKSVILRVCQESLDPSHQLSLNNIAKIFDKLNSIIKQQADTEKSMGQAGTAVSLHVLKQAPVIDQSDMCNYVFSVFHGQNIKPKFVVAVLLEYVRSLTQQQIPVQHYLCEMLIEVLVRYKQFYQLHQFLQYNVLSDSKPLACLMLRLQDIYPPAHQLALDMLKRLQNSNEQIIEVLLSKNQVLPALRFIRNCGTIDRLSAPKYLAAANAAGDNNVFYAVYKFFEQRNMRLRGSPYFQPAEHCDTYIKYYNNIFGNRTLETLEQLPY